MKKFLLALLAAVIIALAVIGGRAMADDTSPPSGTNYRHIYISNVKCKQEYSPGPCFYDAGWQGSGGGHSFWVSEDQCVYYLNPNVGDYCPDGVHDHHR